MFDGRQSLFVKERVAILKLTDTYDILEADQGQTIGMAKDEPATWAKLLRLLVKKALLPTTVRVYEANTPQPVLQIRKRPMLFRGRLEVQDGHGRLLVTMRSKFFSLGGAFEVKDAYGMDLGQIKGDWKGWNFTATLADGSPWGVITKKWAGLAKEFFTNADQYLVQVDPSQAQRPDALAMLLGLALAIDLTYKEQQ